MKLIKAAIVGVFAIALTFAQDPPPCDEWLASPEAHDVNGDGVVDEADCDALFGGGPSGGPPPCDEWLASPEAHDVNGDGVVDEADCDAMFGGPPPFEEIDANGDGVIDREEARALFGEEPDFDSEFDRIDTNGDGVVDREEFEAEMKKQMGEPHDDPMGEPGYGAHTIENCIAITEGRETYWVDGDEYAAWSDPNCAEVLASIDWHPSSEEPGEGTGISEDFPRFEGLPAPPPCDAELQNSELSPQATDVACEGSESVGNLVFRTVCNSAPYNTNAISLPNGRAADCFGIEAIKGHNIEFQIVEEATGNQMFHTSFGKGSLKTLVLTGNDPTSDTVYRIELINADELDAAITVKFIDHPQF